MGTEIAGKTLGVVGLATSGARRPSAPWVSR